jgi:2-polyprenyl-3-methyl-5-hydroxy-6-metoxy-1,4-benzoquinol methylase
VDTEYLDTRPRAVAALMARVLTGYRGMRILDYGGGVGLFARLMHEAGFHPIECYDPISMPMRPVG